MKINASKNKILRFVVITKLSLGSGIDGVRWLFRKHKLTRIYNAKRSNCEFEMHLLQDMFPSLGIYSVLNHWGFIQLLQLPNVGHHLIWRDALL